MWKSSPGFLRQAFGTSHSLLFESFIYGVRNICTKPIRTPIKTVVESLKLLVPLKNTRTVNPRISASPQTSAPSIGGLQPFPRDSNDKDPGGHVG